MNMNFRRLYRLGLAVTAVAAAVLILAACSSSKSDTAASPSSDASLLTAPCSDAAFYCGAIPNQALAKPDMALTDTAGQPFNIAKDTAGDLTLVYLGYTHCPDVCPTFMAQVGQVLKAMPTNVTSDIKVIFITTDPARDTGPVLRKWLDVFDVNFIGLTGTEDQIDQISGMLGVPPPEKEPLGGDNYAVSHGSFIYAFDKDDGKAHLIYPQGFTNEDLTGDFTKLVDQGFQESKVTKG